MPIQKLFCLPCGALVGGAGDINQLLGCIYGAKSLLDVKTPRYNTTILAVDTDRRAYVFEEGVIKSLNKMEFFAIGSGATVAYSALQDGKSAKEAIIAASRLDVFTDNHIQELAFGCGERMPLTPRHELTQRQPVSLLEHLRAWWNLS